MAFGGLSSRLVFKALAVATVGILGSCNNPVSPAATREPIYKELLLAVTEELATQIDSSTARFNTLSGDGEGGQLELSQTAASQFAEAYARQFGPLLRNSLEGQRGTQIQFSALRTCSDVFDARTPFMPLSDTMPGAMRRAYGPYLLVTLCNASEPELNVAVSAWATGLTIVDGRLVIPPIGGGEFFPWPVPVAFRGRYPASPERAVVFASRVAGARVASRPQLFLPDHRDGVPQMARWRMKLEHAVKFRVASGFAESDVVYVGLKHQEQSRDMTIFLPAPNQPESVEVVYPPEPILGESEADYNARLKQGLLRGIATRIDSVAIKFVEVQM